MRIRFSDGSSVKVNAVPGGRRGDPGISKRQSKTRYGKIKWPSASTDTKDVIRAIYNDEHLKQRHPTRVVAEETGYCNGQKVHSGPCGGLSCRVRHVPISTQHSYSYGRGAENGGLRSKV